MSAYSIATRGLAGRKIPQGVLAAINTLLFGASEPGAWYDPSDLSTLFQDSAGTTPVTAVEQPVGRMLDKSGRGNHASQATSTKRPKYSRRVNLLTNTGLTGFVAGSPGSAPTGWANSAVTGDIAAGTSGGLKFILNNTRRTITQVPTVLANTSYLYRIKVNVIVPHAKFYPANILRPIPGGATISSFSWSIDGAAFTAGSEVLSTGVHTVVMRLDVGATGGGVYFAFGSGAIDAVGAVGEIDMWEPEVILLIDANLPYQWVNTPTDYDADPAKFPGYLLFDGVDDALQTANIDFTGTDKMTVWAGATSFDMGATLRISQVIVASLFGGLNSFAIVAPNNAGYTSCASAGSAALAQAPESGLGSAPRNLVLTLVADQVAPYAINRRDGVQRTNNTGNQGATGGYGNRPTTIGGDASAKYLSGRIYSVIVRGAQSSLSQIEATELYIKRKMRLP